MDEERFDGEMPSDGIWLFQQAMIIGAGVVLAVLIWVFTAFVFGLPVSIT